jgi:hypothetical protein
MIGGMDAAARPFRQSSHDRADQTVMRLTLETVHGASLRSAHQVMNKTGTLTEGKPRLVGGFCAAVSAQTRGDITRYSMLG